MNDVPRADQLNRGDEKLRHMMRDLMVQTPGPDSAELQTRVLAQWEQRVAVDSTVSFGPNGIARLLLRSRGIQCGFVVLVLVVALGFQSLRLHGDASLEDLLEPDVLALMALGEL